MDHESLKKELEQSEEKLSYLSEQLKLSTNIFERKHIGRLIKEQRQLITIICHKLEEQTLRGI